MAHFDVFNGDADGICALHQLRLARPCDSTLVTGVKRDISLVKRVDARPGDTVEYGEEGEMRSWEIVSIVPAF